MITVETISGRGMVAGPSRRGFLEGIGATAFLLAFQLPVSPGRAGEPQGVSEQFNAFLAIGEDDVVTAIIAQTEGGQGNSTGMTQVIAAELGAAWPQMRFRFTTELQNTSIRCFEIKSEAGAPVDLWRNIQPVQRPTDQEKLLSSAQPRLCRNRLLGRGRRQLSKCEIAAGVRVCHFGFRQGQVARPDPQLLRRCGDEHLPRRRRRSAHGAIKARDRRAPRGQDEPFVEDTHNGFLLETMIDEAAHATGADPLEYRHRLLSKNARSIAILDRAAAIAGWGKVATGHHQGIAYLQSEFYRCRLAVIVEVSGTADALKVERLVGVCDSGLAVNPLLAERAVEAGMIFGVSNAMSERITLAGGAPEQTNFDSCCRGRHQCGPAAGR
jgi:CO/xanthine dehydrogenase Mo-binding subunit